MMLTETLVLEASLLYIVKDTKRNGLKIVAIYHSSLSAPFGKTVDYVLTFIFYKIFDQLIN
ncbi:hypothetical protein C7M40_03245 (plasmid) [Lactiplantibacillus plantarum]|nr:hypothetical protein C7M40_03245 [Lactiplantibacillus plantarum]